MTDDWDDDSAPAPTGGAVANIDVLVPDVKLFNKWSCDDVNVSDMSLQDYIPVKEKSAKYLPHSAGRYAVKRFRKAQCPIVERLVNSLMMHGRNNGKKLMTVRIVKHSFEIIHLLTGEVRDNILKEFFLAWWLCINHQDLWTNLKSNFALTDYNFCNYARCSESIFKSHF